MGRAPVQPEVLVGPVEPDDDAQRGHRAVPFGSNHMPRPSRSLAPGGKGVGKRGVHRDQATAALLCRAITQLDDIADLASRVDHHVPRQACDLASAQAGFRRQQDNYSIADRMAGASGKNQEIVDLGDGQYFRLLAWHVSNQDNMICSKNAVN